MINKKRALKTFMELVSIDSSSLDEKNIANYLKELFKDYEVIEDLKAKDKLNATCGNIIVKIPGDDSLKPLILCSHMDRVEPGLNIEPIFSEDQNFIVSKGETILGADDCAGITQIIEITRILKENNLKHRPLELVFTIGEEIGLLGAKNLDISLIKAREAIIIDSASKPGEAVIGGPSYYKVTGMIKGKAAHAGLAPETGISSIQVVSHAISKLDLLRIDENTTVNIGQVRCDFPLNVVPEYTSFALEVRSLIEENAALQVGKIIETFQNTADEFKAIFTFEVERQLVAFKFSDDNPVLSKYINVCSKKGIEAVKVVAGGGTDLSVLNSEFGIEGIVTSYGGMNPHQTTEALNIKNFLESLDIILSYILD